MVQLVDGDIKTREVLDWKGVHVLHFMGSSCSQKLRIFLNLKGIEWQSHIVDLFTNENFRPWFLGINPRGLVPVLVHDGAVHIESNDIIAYLEKTFPTPKLVPAGHENEGTLFKGPRSIDEVKLTGPIVYVKLYGATSFDIQYTNYRQPY